MFQEFFQGRLDLLAWPLVGLVIFLGSFVAVMAYVFVGLSDRRKRDHLAELPLAGESPVEDAALERRDHR